MTMLGSLRGAAAWLRLVAALGVVVVLVGVAGPNAGADQTVTFDGAGDAPHVSLIGDSTLSGVRWYADYGALRHYNFVLSAESCRRTAVPSCISREGYRAASVIAAMRGLDGQLGRVVVVMSGYNDPVDSIGDAIAGVVDEARRQGVEHVVWLTLRTSADVDYSDPQHQSSINTFRTYNERLVEAAAASDGYLQVADWATWSNGASAWFERDGVHLTPRGVDAVTDYLAAILSRVLAGEDVSPAAAPWTVLVPGAEGPVVEAVQSALLDAGIELRGGVDGDYGNDTMAAVAAYQRATDGLQVTGAVDLATARSLGVYKEPEATIAATPADEPASMIVAAAAVRTGTAVSPPAPGSGGPPYAVIVVSAILGALVLAVVARRRFVVVKRRARRWARVHPATSPHRSVADQRCVGTLPADGAVRAGDRQPDRV